MTLPIQDAEMIAISALQFLANDAEQLSRFSALSGIAPDEFRENAASPSFLIGVLDFFLGHEPTLLALSASTNIAPDAIVKARQSLEHG